MSNIKKLFDSFVSLNKKMNNEVLELSVKQHQISILCNDSLLSFESINSINISDESFVSTHNDNLYLVIGGLSPDNIKDYEIFHPFMEIIWKFAEEICQCPSLEYKISEQYIKCFLDKPGLKANDLKKYEAILEADNKGELELHPQRAYLLFINEDYKLK